MWHANKSPNRFSGLGWWVNRGSGSDTETIAHTPLKRGVNERQAALYPGSERQKARIGGVKSPREENGPAPIHASALEIARAIASQLVTVQVARVRAAGAGTARARVLLTAEPNRGRAVNTCQFKLS